MLFAFVVSILGFAFAIRIAHHFIAQHLFDRSELTKIGTAYFAFVFASSFTFSHSRFALWVIVFAPLVAIFIFLEILLCGRAREFRRDFTNVLSLVILKMKSGHAFRHAFSQTIAECNARMRPILSEIASVVAFSQQEFRHNFDPFIAEMIEELTVIDRQPHAAVKRIATLRDRLKVENEFRRRSGQVLARIRAQSAVMTALFVAILIFMGLKFGFAANAKVIGAATVSFAAGSAWLWIGGRSITWKV